MRKILCLTLLAFLALTTGCASIVSKSQYPVVLISNPPGATVSVKNRAGMEVHRAQTPSTVSLNASAGFFSPAKYTMDFEMQGYQKSTAHMDASIDGWYAGNIIFGGLIGLLIVDPATGAMWRLDENLIATLSKDPEAPAASVPAPQPPVAVGPVQDQPQELK